MVNIGSLRISFRSLAGQLRVAIISIVAILAAFTAAGILIYSIGEDPFRAYREMLTGVIGSRYSLSEVVVKAVPLCIAAAGVAIAFRVGFWNIGSEGQIYLGALLATWVGISLKDVPAIVTLPLILVSGFIGGGVWVFIPGILKVKFKVDEVLSTIMLNYVGIQLISYFVIGPLREPGSMNPQTSQIGINAQLPFLISGTRVHLGTIIGVLVCILLFIFLTRTVLGYEIRCVGGNESASQFAGIKPRRMILLTALISGGYAGLAGGIEISGIYHRLFESFSAGLGYDAIAVALLGRLTLPGIFLASLLFGGLRVGAGAMQRSLALPISIIYVIEGLIVLFVLIGTQARLSKQISLWGRIWKNRLKV